MDDAEACYLWKRLEAQRHVEQNAERAFAAADKLANVALVTKQVFDAIAVVASPVPRRIPLDHLTSLLDKAIEAAINLALNARLLLRLLPRIRIVR